MLSYDEQIFQYKLEFANRNINSAVLTNLLNSLSVNKDKKNQIWSSNVIEMTLLNQEEIQDIYFLDNTDYIDENGIKHFHDGLQELNESNVDLYINDLKTKFQKHYIFSRANYKIKLIIKTNITNCKNMFYGCSNLTSIDLSSFDTKNVTNMSGMFCGCSNLKQINLSSFNTEKVTVMSFMFSHCDVLSSLDLSSFNTKKVTDMRRMFSGSFYYIYNSINLNLKSFDTENVRNMEGMFNDCENVNNIYFSHLFNTRNVTDMSYMFKGCKKLMDLDLSSFDTSNVTNMKAMFEHCNNLEKLDLSSFNTKNVTNMYAMFFCCENLLCLDLSSFDTRKVINMQEMFDTCANLLSLNLSSFDTRNIKTMKKMFCNCNKLTDVIFNNNVDTSIIRKEYEQKIYGNPNTHLFFIK